MCDRIEMRRFGRSIQWLDLVLLLPVYYQFRSMAILEHELAWKQQLSWIWQVYWWTWSTDHTIDNVETFNAIGNCTNQTPHCEVQTLCSELLIKISTDAGEGTGLLGMVSKQAKAVLIAHCTGPGCVVACWTIRFVCAFVCQTVVISSLLWDL